MDALYSPQRIENYVGRLLLAIAGLADTARVIVVLCERVGKVNSYGILAVRGATPEEIKMRRHHIAAIAGAILAI